MLIDLNSAQGVLDKCKPRSEVCAVTRLSKRMLSKFGTDNVRPAVGLYVNRLDLICSRHTSSAVGAGRRPAARVVKGPARRNAAVKCVSCCCSDWGGVCLWKDCMLSS